MGLLPADLGNSKISGNFSMRLLVKFLQQMLLPPLDTTEVQVQNPHGPNTSAYLLPQPAPVPMSYDRCNPDPCIPEGFQQVAVQNGDPVVQAVLVLPRPLNEDLTIITIDPLPNHQVHFEVLHDVIREFLVDHKGVALKEIQPCHLGQAYVRFENVHDRSSSTGESRASK